MTALRNFEAGMVVNNAEKLELIEMLELVKKTEFGEMK